MNIPEDLKYTNDHEWIKVENDIGIVGVTDYAQGQLGDVVFVEVEKVDDYLDIQETYGAIEAVKTVSDIFMPVSGTVTEFNEALAVSPELVNKDPYGEGWIIKIRIENPTELDDLLSADEYKKVIEGLT